MRNKRTMSLITAAFLLAAFNAKAYAYQDGDFQIWHTEAQEFNLKKGWKLPLEEEFRYGDSASELYYQHYEIGITYDFGKSLTVGAFYRQIYEGEKGKFKPEYRPHIDATPKWDIYGFRLENRNRLDYRLHDDNRADRLQYRNRVTLKSPWKFTPLNIQPYVQNEIFVWLDSVAFYRDRFDAGVSFDILKEIKGDVYYRLQSTKKSGRWTDHNILGLKLKVLF
ncbi:MAG: DUF2490 domain-containing protein [Candidatus Omnitrophica bacterium]|nr:DUF2490 domain-containing protein [Candidatus Omnitrophota bacterium]MBU1038459.1 DUF2490 domain-containing protein [Candidatus Omnitrophota bacterium]